MTANGAQHCRLFLLPAGEAGRAGAALLCSLSYPRAVSLHALIAPLEGEAVPAFPPADAEQLDIVLLPSGSQTSFALQDSAADWLRNTVAQGRFENLSADLKLRQGQISIRGQQVVIQSAPELFRDMLAGVGAFGWLWLNIEDAERAVETAWDQHHDDAELLERSSYSRKISSSLAAKVAETARLRQWFLKSTLLLERGDRGLPPASRRSFFELCQQMDFGRRLQLIGEVIEARETLYGTAAERSFEYRLFFVSCIIEAAILAGILIEIAIMLYDL